MFEVLGQEIPAEGCGIPDNEAVVGLTPGHRPVCLWIVHHLLALAQERWHDWDQRARSAAAAAAAALLDLHS